LPEETKPKPKGKMTVEEAGRKGGEKTAETHGREFYQEIGKKGGETVASERGPEFYSEIGKKGGSVGGPKVRKLIQEAKEHEEKR
jgi:general stress protein YciG